MKRGPVKIGIIGAGNVLEAYLPQCDKLRARGLAEVVRVCGREPQRARAEALGAVDFTTDETAILAAGNVDLVLILASMPEHARLVRAALESGKHVVVEKPLAATVEEGRELVGLATRVDRHLVCAPFTTLSPTFSRIASTLQSGKIGKPCLARGRYGWSGPWWSDWFYKQGGGCTFDLAVYPLTTLTGLLGPVRRVSAMMNVSIPEREINGRTVQVEAEDNAQITLEFASGALGTVMSGFTMQQYRNPAIEIYGTTGTIQMLGDDWDPDGFELWENEAGCWKMFKETHPEWSWTDGLRHTIECLHTGVQPQVSAEQALHVLEVMTRARDSARSGRTLEVESEFAISVAAGPAPAEAAHLQHDRTREHLEVR